MSDEIEKVILESGVDIKPVYTPADISNLDCSNPGEFPFTRGIHPLMYRKQPWTMRQYAGFGRPEKTNQRFKFLIAHGQNALNVAFDLPTQMGLDSDDPMAQGEVGRVGMAVDTIDDMKKAFDGIPLDKISVSLTINAVALTLCGMYFAIAEEQKVANEEVRGTAQNDILKEFIGRGAWVFPVDPAARMVCDLIEFCTRYYPRYNPVSVCGYHIRESGANPAQEIGYAFGIAKSYIQETLKRGIDIDSFAPRLSFNFNVFGNLWEQVAKFRAARRLWSKIIKNEFNAKDSKSMHLRMIAGGGGSGLTLEEPENNIVRGAYYALAGALGGAQTMALCCYDEAYTIPSEKASLISLRTMQILADEIGMCDTVDPLAGSYYIEWLTSKMEEKIKESISEVQSMGGMISAIKSGEIQRKLGKQAYEYYKKIQSGEIVKVAVNKYISEQKKPDVKLYEYDCKQVEDQISRLRLIRNKRNTGEATRAIDQIKKAATDGTNLMPSIVHAVKIYVTVGEITKALKSVFGEFKEPRF